MEPVQEYVGCVIKCVVLEKILFLNPMKWKILKLFGDIIKELIT